MSVVSTTAADPPCPLCGRMIVARSSSVWFHNRRYHATCGKERVERYRREDALARSLTAWTRTR